MTMTNQEFATHVERLIDKFWDRYVSGTPSLEGVLGDIRAYCDADAIYDLLPPLPAQEDYTYLNVVHLQEDVHAQLCRDLVQRSATGTYPF